MIQKKQSPYDGVSKAKADAQYFLKRGDYDNAARACAIAIKEFSRWLYQNPKSKSELHALRGEALLYADLCFRKAAEKEIGIALSYDNNNSRLWELRKLSQSNKPLSPDAIRDFDRSFFLGCLPPDTISGSELNK